jgi:hypothetical protein
MITSDATCPLFHDVNSDGPLFARANRAASGILGTVSHAHDALPACSHNITYIFKAVWDNPAHRVGVQRVGQLSFLAFVFTRAHVPLARPGLAQNYILTIMITLHFISPTSNVIITRSHPASAALSRKADLGIGAELRVEDLRLEKLDEETRVWFESSRDEL